MLRTVNWMGMLLTYTCAFVALCALLRLCHSEQQRISRLFNDIRVVGRHTEMKQRAFGCGLCNVSTIKPVLATLLPSDPTAKERSNTRLSYPIRAPPAKTHQSLDLFLTKVGQTSNSGLSTGHSFVLSELCAMSSGEDPLFTIVDTPLLSPLAPYLVYIPPVGAKVDECICKSYVYRLQPPLVSETGCFSISLSSIVPSSDWHSGTSTRRAT